MLLEATACRRLFYPFLWPLWIGHHDYVFIGWLNYYDSRSLLPKLEARKIQCLQTVSVFFKKASILNSSFSIIIWKRFERDAIFRMRITFNEVRPKTVILTFLKTQKVHFCYLKAENSRNSLKFLRSISNIPISSRRNCENSWGRPLDLHVFQCVAFLHSCSSLRYEKPRDAGQPSVCLLSLTPKKSLSFSLISASKIHESSWPQLRSTLPLLQYMTWPQRGTRMSLVWWLDFINR